MPIHFGTDGWRAVISDTFTLDNLRIVAQAIADAVGSEQRGGKCGNGGGPAPDPKKIVVGFDTRFLSDRYAVEVSRVLAANGFTVLLANSDAPTPAIIGYGTFQPVRVDEVDDHRMLPEYFEVSKESATFIRTRKASGRMLVAVGTTTTRVLEYLTRDGNLPPGGASGMCDLFIYPGFSFRILDGLLTNFHLPRSTPFLLACAFAGRELMLECYREARDQGYRFYSYGDAMLIV